jgi:hypothetical protein
MWSASREWVTNAGKDEVVGVEVEESFELEEGFAER